MTRRVRSGGERTLTREQERIRKLRLEREAARGRIRRRGAHALALVREVAAGLDSAAARELALSWRRALRGLVSYSSGVVLRPRARVKVTSRSAALNLAGGELLDLVREVAEAVALLCAPELARKAVAVVNTHKAAARASLEALLGHCEAAGDTHVPSRATQPALPAVDMTRAPRCKPGERAHHA